MKITREHWLIRYAYLTSDHLPQRTNLCRLFWRVVFRTVGFLVLGALLAIAGVAVAIYLAAWYQAPWLAAKITGAFLGVVGLVSTARWMVKRADARRLAPRPPGVIEEGFWAVKNRVCPIIEIDRGEEVLVTWPGPEDEDA